jgi:hypothetical protein
VTFGSDFQGAVTNAALSERAFVSSPLGNVKWNAVPCGKLGDAQRWPPWASTIEVLIDRPIPMPPGLVVKKASKMGPHLLHRGQDPNPRR